MTGSIRCPNCGKDNFAFVSFCHACGEPLSDPSGDLELTGPGGATESSPRTQPSSGAGNPARRFLRWESALGLLVLLLTLGYALFNWQQSNEQASAYHQGIAAEQSKDWDKAVEEFSKAGDTQDSPKRKSEAASNVVERNNQYQRGMTASRQNNWTQAISSFAKVQNIQPGYLDAEARLKQARVEAFNKGLDGLVYLVSFGDTPGLYVRDSQGRSALLPGSDKQSTVRAIAPDRKLLVYDRPSRELDYLGPAINHNSIVPDPFGPDKTDRIPALAQIDPDGTIKTVPLPRLDPDGQGVFSETGLWWFSAQPGADVFGYEVYYTAQLTGDGPYTQPVRVSDVRNNRRVVALDPPRSRVIIAEVSGDQRSGDRETRLYLADASGNAIRMIHKVDGDVLQASVSNDGRRLLYINQEVRGGISRTVWVAPLDAGTVYGIESHWPRQLQILSWEGLQMDVNLTASFVPQADPNGKDLPLVIIDRVENGVETVTLHNLTSFLATTLWKGTPERVYRSSASGFTQDGSLIASRRQSGRTARLEIMKLSPGNSLRSEAALPAYPDQVVKIQFSAPGDYALASVQNPDGINRGIGQTLYSIKVDKDGRPASGEVKRIAGPNLPYDTDYSPVALPTAGYMAAYVTPGKELHSVFLDGSNDTLLAQNVDAVWSLESRTDLSWWR